MTTCVLVIDLKADVLGGGVSRSTFMFGDFEAAKAVHDDLAKAMADWHERANDRARIFTFEPLHSVASVDVSCVCSMGVDNTLGGTKEQSEEWAAHVGRLNALYRGDAPQADAA